MKQRKFKEGSHIIYGILGELFYAVVMDPDSDFPSPNYVSIKTIYSFYGKYDDGKTGLSPQSELEIKYVRGNVEANLTKEYIFEHYPEFLI